MTAYSNVEKWAKPERAPLSLNFSAMRPVIRKEPKGVVLIIGPFNYPIFLLLGPLVNLHLLSSQSPIQDTNSDRPPGRLYRGW